MRSLTSLKLFQHWLMEKKFRILHIKKPWKNCNQHTVSSECHTVLLVRPNNRTFVQKKKWQPSKKWKAAKDYWCVTFTTLKLKAKIHNNPHYNKSRNKITSWINQLMWKNCATASSINIKVPFFPVPWFKFIGPSLSYTSRFNFDPSIKFLEVMCIQQQQHSSLKP